MRGGLFALVACVTLTSGCARTTVSTWVNSDGSWTRTLKFRAASDAGLENAFLLPSGTPWVTSRVRQEEETLYTARRALLPGEPLRQDVVVRDKQKPALERLLTNEVTVREVGPNRWEYREVLHWQGPRPAQLLEPDPRLVRVIQAALPQALAGGLAARELAKGLRRDLWRICFGPGEPVLWEALMHPDVSERWIQKRLDRAVDQRLQAQFGQRLAPADRLTVARRLAATTLDTIRVSDSEEEEWPGRMETALVPLTFAVSLPGKVVATNGELGESSGEVFWGLYSGAAISEDVVLTATGELVTTASGRRLAPVRRGGYSQRRRRVGASEAILGPRPNEARGGRGAAVRNREVPRRIAIR